MDSNVSGVNVHCRNQHIHRLSSETFSIEAELPNAVSTNLIFLSNKSYDTLYSGAMPQNNPPREQK